LKYAVAIPSNGPVHIAWAIMYSQLQWPVSGERNTIVPVKVPIATARNNCAIQAQKRGCKYLVFIDDDVLIPDSAMKLMLYQMEQNDDWDAITGVYCTKSIPPEPLIFGGKPEDVSGPYWDWKMGETFPVWGAGLGCCVIRVSAFDKIEEPYFAFVESSDGMNSEKEGEDLHFFRKLYEAGGKVFCNGSILCGHMDRKDDKVYSMWKDSKPYKNRIPELAETLERMVPDEPTASVISKSA
jgi:glycosyltransferase involved in cell wall biosynthesis